MLITRRAFASLAAAAVGASLLSAPVQAEDTVTLKVHHFLPPPSTAHAKLIEPWAKRIEEASQGRIKFEIYPAMQLGGKPPQLFDQVRNGVVDVVWTLPGYTAGRFPLTEVFELPFVTGSAEATSQAVWEFYEKNLQEEYKDIHPLLLHVHAPGPFHMKEGLVRTAADLKGKKIRLPTKPIGEALKALGAVPVGMPVPEVYEAMSRGVVDGTVIPWEVVLPLRVNELAEYHTASGLYTSVFLLAMNKDTYAGLPDDLKAIIDEHSGANLAPIAGRAYDEAENGGRKQAEEMGHKFHTLTPEEEAKWKAATRPVIDAWIAKTNDLGHDGARLYQEAVDLVEKYSR